MEILSFLLAMIGAVSMLYKIYVEDRLRHPEKKGGWDLLWRRSRPIHYFFPIDRNSHAPEDYPLVKRANIALFIAYGVIVAAFVWAYL